MPRSPFYPFWSVFKPGVNRLRIGMRYLVAATDYDGTLATDGLVSQEAIQALERLRASGRRLILVTGREVKDLSRIFGPVDLFEYVVAENGAVLYRPAGRHTKVLADPPPDQFVRALRKRRGQAHPGGRGRGATAKPEAPGGVGEGRGVRREPAPTFQQQ